MCIETGYLQAIPMVVRGACPDCSLRSLVDIISALIADNIAYFLIYLEMNCL